MCAGPNSISCGVGRARPPACGKSGSCASSQVGEFPTRPQAVAAEKSSARFGALFVWEDRVDRIPTLDYERLWWDAGFRRVAGLDEAGRGAWAGPVVAAAVILPADQPDLLRRLAGVRDSKMLSPARREALLAVICEAALAWGVGLAPAAEIDQIGIVPATRAAMLRALERLSPAADALLID
ncbi:MAG TPA: ribonuclease HII, partial [Anaerolineae bacterium]|nr:ribonuclease HII [Anaerolineae bacterium]